MPYSVYLYVDPTKGSAPLTVRLSGGVAVDGYPYVADVSIYRNAVLIKTVKSNGPYGTFETYDTLTAAGTYNYQAKAMGVESAIRTVTVTAPPPEKKATALVLVCSPLTGYAPLEVTAYATLSDEDGGSVPGRKVKLYVNDVLKTTKTTDGLGKIKASVSLKEPGTYYFEAKFDGDEFYKPSTSNIVTVAVKKAPPPPPGKGTLTVEAYVDTEEVPASVEVVDVRTYTTPFTIDLDPGTYTLNALYQDYPAQTKTVTIIEGKTTTVKFQFGVPPKPEIPWLLLIGGSIVLGGVILYAATRK